MLCCKKVIQEIGIGYQRMMNRLARWGLFEAMNVNKFFFTKEF